MKLGTVVTFTDRFETFTATLIRARTYGWCYGANEYSFYRHDNHTVYSLPLYNCKVVDDKNYEENFNKAVEAYTAHLKTYPKWAERLAEFPDAATSNWGIFDGFKAGKREF